MKRRYVLIFPCILVGMMTACNGSEEQEETADVDLNKTLDSLSEDLDDSIWEYKADSLFEIELPTLMKEMEELNPTATLEYGYFERLGEEVKENYIIAIPHLKDELLAESPDHDYNVENYADLSVSTLMKGKDKYEIVNQVKTESVNGLNARVHEIEAQILLEDSATVNAFYILGVYESEKAFYQVLTWTLLNQKGDFRSDMRRMIYSFREV